MLVNDEIYWKLCSDYKTALNKLEDELASDLDFETKEKCFINFTKHFTTFPEMWNDWIDFIKLTFPMSETVCEKIFLASKKALGHFYDNKILNEMMNSSQNPFIQYQMWTKLIDFPFDFHHYFLNWNQRLYTFKVLERKLYLPSKDLEYFYETFQIFSNTPITKEIEEKYENAVKLYEKIAAAEKTDHEKWLFYMKETNDQCFIIQNFEQKLGKSSMDKSLWKLYLTFLEEKGFCLLKLYVYSRYCRLFINDSEMLENYENEILRFGNLNLNVTKYQIDLIKFRKEFISEKSSLKLIKKYLKECPKFTGLKNNEEIFEAIELFETDESQELSVFSVDKEIVEFRESKLVQFHLTKLQKFGIPESLLYYMLKTAKFKLLQKLYASSKQIYSLIKIPICHRLEIVDRPFTTSFKQGLYLSTKTLEIKEAKSLYLTNSLSVISENQNILSKILPKIYKCEIELLIIPGQIISLKEFEFLATNVKIFHSFNNTTIGEKDTVSIQDIIDRLPKLSKIRIANLRNEIFLTKTKTAKKILSNKNRISLFVYKNVKEMVDTNLLYNFLTQNFKQNSAFAAEFSPEIPESYKASLRNIISTKLNAEEKLIYFNVL